MINAIIFFVLGAVASWAISHYYYRRGNKKRPDWFSIESIKEILTKHPEDMDWTARQIVNLYNEKIFDSNSSDPLPFNCCPKCGSEKLEKSTFDDYKRDESYYVISCKECGWSDWTQ